MEEAVVALRAFNRFHTRFVGALDAHYLDSELSLAEARLLYEIASRPEPLAAELQAELGLDAGYVSRIVRRFQSRGWIRATTPVITSPNRPPAFSAISITSA